MKPPTPEQLKKALSSWFSEMGRKGGKSKSPKKLAAIKKNSQSRRKA